jgi:hypothetical protein
MNCLIHGAKIFIQKTTWAYFVGSVITEIYVRCLKESSIGPYSKIHFNLILPSETRFYMQFFKETIYTFVSPQYSSSLPFSSFITILMFRASCNLSSIFKPQCVNQY